MFITVITVSHCNTEFADTFRFCTRRTSTDHKNLQNFFHLHLNATLTGYTATDSILFYTMSTAQVYCVLFLEAVVQSHEQEEKDEETFKFPPNM